MERALLEGKWSVCVYHRYEHYATVYFPSIYLQLSLNISPLNVDWQMVRKTKKTRIGWFQFISTRGRYNRTFNSCTESHKLKFSFAHKLLLKCRIVLQFCTEQGTIPDTAVLCAYFKTVWRQKWIFCANDILRDDTRGKNIIYCNNLLATNTIPT